MKDTHPPAMTSRIRRGTVIVVAAIAAAGVLFTGWTVTRSDRGMRRELLDQARMVAQAVSLERVRALSGTDADLTTPEYLRFKEQLACTRAVIPGCRFVYLLGRRAGGSVFFFVDSEPVGSEDESPAGQIYGEISDEDLRAFDEPVALTSGPAEDRWGKWISALVPLTDPDTGTLVAVLGMDFDARDWQRMLTRAALPPIALTLIMAVVLAIGSIGGRRLFRRAGRSRPPLAYVDTILAIGVVGIFLSVSTAWVVGEKENLARMRAFR